MTASGAAGEPQSSPTAPRRRPSNKAQLQRRIADLIVTVPTTAGWTADGFRPDLDLLSSVLALTDPRDVRGGSVATGLDLWAAATLRQAGLRAVRPFASEPFYAGTLAHEAQSMFVLIDQALGDLAALDPRVSSVAQREGVELRRASQRLATQLRRLRAQIERGAGAVLGESRRKQVDVFMAEWDRGLELLISTKTFALAVNVSELVKNLPNRWEEFDGDLKNLRGRFPLAVIGALTILPAIAVRQNVLPAFVDMMTKLTAPGRPWVNAYDRATIIVADWEHATADAVPILNSQLDEAQLPTQLQPTEFFDTLLDRLFERAPVAEHADARIAARHARGENAQALAQAASALEAAENAEQ